MFKTSIACLAVLTSWLSAAGCAPDRGFGSAADESGPRDAAVAPHDALHSEVDAADGGAADATRVGSQDDVAVRDDEAPAPDVAVSRPDVVARADARATDAAVSAGVCACDPVAQTGCGAGLACYIVSDTLEFLGTVCASPGSGGIFSACTQPNDCAPGFGCVDASSELHLTGMCWGMCNPGEAVPEACRVAGRNNCDTDHRPAPCVGVCSADIHSS